jgi:hypothetical protein
MQHFLDLFYWLQTKKRGGAEGSGLWAGATSLDEVFLQIKQPQAMHSGLQSRAVA